MTAAATTPDDNAPGGNGPDGGDDDRRFDLAISRLLRTGVAVSSLLVGVGGILFCIQYRTEQVNYHHFVQQPAALTTIPGIIGLALDGDSRGVMQAGVLLLLLTPIIRVAFSLLAFLQQRDWIYIGISSFVLSVLMYSLLGAGSTPSH